MQRHAFVAKLKPQHRDDYIRVHRNVPSELLARYSQAGIRNLSVFLHDDFLFLYLESDDFDRAQAALENDPSEIKWQSLTSPMLEAGGYQECVDLFHMD